MKSDHLMVERKADVLCNINRQSLIKTLMRLEKTDSIQKAGGRSLPARCLFSWCVCAWAVLGTEVRVLHTLGTDLPLSYHPSLYSPSSQNTAQYILRMRQLKTACAHITDIHLIWDLARMLEKLLPLLKILKILNKNHVMEKLTSST